MLVRLAVLILFALSLPAICDSAQAQKRRPALEKPRIAPEKPRVPPDRDPGGVLVALISQGIDYRQPALAAKLARDGEGELIGWDLVDNDRLPFDQAEGNAPAEQGGDATAIAGRASAGAVPIRFAPIRVDADDAGSLARAVRLAAQTRARIVLVPMWSRDPARWHLFATAAAAQPGVLFILAAADGPKPEEAYPAAFALENAIVVSSGEEREDSPGFAGQWRALSPGHFALAVAAARAARLIANDPGIDVARLKTALERPAAGKP